MNDQSFWYPLDNAAKIFPAITNDEVTSVFRISVVLLHKIHIKSLFAAVRTIEKRFPYYRVCLKKGFFWYYLESAYFLTPVVVDDKMPCRRFEKESQLMRVLVADNRISVEFSHLLTDGGGALEYFKTLLTLYFQNRDIEIKRPLSVIDISENPDPEEFEDAYNRFFKENIPVNTRRPRAFHLPYSLSIKPRLKVLSARVSTAALKEKASEKGVNITVYLTSVYLYAMQQLYEDPSIPRRKKKTGKLSIQIPVNLRNLYPSKSMRNFSLFVLPEIDCGLGHYSFDEILKTVYHQMQLETDRKLVSKILSRNVGSERKILIRTIPLFLKNSVLRINHRTMGCNQYSGVLSNMGVLVFPPEIQEHIESVMVIPPPPNKMIKAGCGIIGYKDRISVTFVNITRSRELEKHFFRFLTKEHIPVTINYTRNYHDEYL
ncbi:MAG: hypothetical protein WCQ69_03330 [Bacteroidales bacterium]|jgi:NRPS condensation-like uncharacterized protein|nr:hypothetical protein [Bacteroidales bacterium]MDD2264935.1 hypothetical protein [Bacteroidales bacterium]MDD2831929.1 hypothetical protein [Bacteroidales bacterium]MDD3209359.1 hypothetical protein [Bacteroidales bacterium]MDD3698025.1 hypothetical protein [Bacteroidales bacterium]